MGFLLEIIKIILKKFYDLIQSSLPPEARKATSFIDKLRHPFNFIASEKKSPTKNKLMQKILAIVKKYFGKLIAAIGKVAFALSDVLIVVFAVVLIGVMLSAMLGAFGAFNGKITIDFDKFQELNSDESIYMDAQNTNELRKAYMQQVSESSYYQMFNLSDINPESVNPFTKSMVKVYNKFVTATGIGEVVTQEDLYYVNMSRSLIGWLTQDDRYIYSDANKNALKYLKLPHLTGIDDTLGDLTRNMNEVDNNFRDYYNRETTFQLSETLLSEMNRILFGEFSNTESITYPEAFTKPVAFVKDYYRIQDSGYKDYIGEPYVYTTQRVTLNDINNSSSQFYNKPWLEGIIKSQPSHIIYDYAVKEKNMYYWSNDSGKLQTQMSWGNIGSYVTDTTVETLEDGTEIEKEEAIKLYWRVKDSDAPYNDSKVVDKVSGSSVNPYNQHMGNSIYDEEQEAYTSINASNYRDYFDGPYLTMSVSGDKVTLSNRICETNPDGTFTKAFEEVDGIRIRCEYNAYPLKHLQLVSIFNEFGNMQVNSRVLFNKNFVQKKSVRDSYRFFPEYFSNFENFANADLEKMAPAMGLEKLFPSSDSDIENGTGSCTAEMYEDDQKLPFSERKCSIIRRYTGTNGYAYIRAKMAEWGTGISNFFTGEDAEAEINISSEAMFYLLLAYDDYIIETGEYGVAWDYKYYTATTLDMDFAKAQYMDIYGFKEIFVDSWNDTAVYKDTLDTVKALDSKRTISTTYVPTSVISGQSAKKDDGGKNNANNSGYGWRIADTGTSSNLNVASSAGAQKLERVAGEASLEMPSYSTESLIEQLSSYITNSVFYGKKDFKYHYDADGALKEQKSGIESWQDYINSEKSDGADASLIDALKEYNEGGDWRNTEEAWNPEANVYRPANSKDISKSIESTIKTYNKEGRVSYQTYAEDYLPYEVKSVRDYGLGSVLSYIQDFRVVYQAGVFMDETYNASAVNEWFADKGLPLAANGYYPRQFLDSTDLLTRMKSTPIDISQLQEFAQMVVSLQYGATENEIEMAENTAGQNATREQVRQELLKIIANRNINGVYVGSWSDVKTPNGVTVGDSTGGWPFTKTPQSTSAPVTTNICKNALEECEESDEDKLYSDERKACLLEKQSAGYYFNESRFDCERRCTNDAKNAIDAIHPSYTEEERGEKESKIETKKNECMQQCKADWPDLAGVCNASMPSDAALKGLFVYGPYLKDSFWENAVNKWLGWISDDIKTYNQVQFLDPLQYYLEWFDFSIEDEESLVSKALHFLAGEEFVDELITGVSSGLAGIQNTDAGFSTSWTVKDTSLFKGFDFGNAGTQVTQKFKNDFYNKYRSNIEPMELIMENESYRVYMIDSAVTFLGTFTYTYKNDIANIGGGTSQSQIVSIGYADRYYYLSNYIYSIPVLKFEPELVDSGESGWVDSRPSCPSSLSTDAAAKKVDSSILVRLLPWLEPSVQVRDTDVRCYTESRRVPYECGDDVCTTGSDGKEHCRYVSRTCYYTQYNRHYEHWATVGRYQEVSQNYNIDTYYELEDLFQQNSALKDKTYIEMKVYDSLKNWSWSLSTNNSTDINTAFSHDYTTASKSGPMYNGDSENHYKNYKDVLSNIKNRTGYDVVDEDKGSLDKFGFPNDLEMDINFEAGQHKINDKNLLDKSSMDDILSAAQKVWDAKNSTPVYVTVPASDGFGSLSLVGGTGLTEKSEDIGVGLMVANREDYGYPIPFFRHYSGVMREILPRQRGYYFNGEVYDSWNSRLILDDEMTNTQRKAILEEKDYLQGYLYDYIMNFEAYVPLDVKSDYDLMSRARVAYHTTTNNTTSNVQTTASLSNDIMQLAKSDAWKDTVAEYGTGLSEASVAQLISGLIETTTERTAQKSIIALNQGIAEGQPKIVEDNNNMSKIRNVVLQAITGGNSSLSQGGADTNVNLSGVLFLGDSLTEGLNNTANLSAKGATVDAVVGRNIKQCNDAARSRSGFKVVVIGIGTNDYSASESSFKNNYQQLIDTVKTNNPDATIYINTLPGVNEEVAKNTGYSITNSAVNAKNRIIKKLAEDNLIGSIDINAKLGAIKKEDTTDGLHMKGATYTRWFNILKSEIASGGGIGNPGVEVSLTMDDGSSKTFRLPEVGPGMIYYDFNKGGSTTLSTDNIAPGQACGSGTTYEHCFANTTITINDTTDERLDKTKALDYVSSKFGRLVRKYGNIKFAIMAYFYGEEYTDAMSALAEQNGWGDSWLNSDDKDHIAQALAKVTGDTAVLGKADSINTFMYTGSVVEKVMSYIQNSADKTVANNASVIPASASGVAIGSQKEQAQKVYQKWQGYFQKYCAEYKVDLALAVAMFTQESGGNSYSGMCGSYSWDGDGIDSYTQVNNRTCSKLTTNIYNGGGGIGQIHAPGLGDNGCSATGSVTCNRTIKSSVTGKSVTVKMADPQYWVKNIGDISSFLQKDDRYGNPELSFEWAIILISNHLNNYGNDAFKAAVAYNGTKGVNLKADDWYETYKAKSGANYVVDVFRYYDESLSSTELSWSDIGSNAIATSGTSGFGLKTGDIAYKKDLFQLQNSGVELYRPRMTTSRDDVTTLLLNVSNYGKENYYMYAKEHDLLSLFTGRDKDSNRNDSESGGSGQITQLGQKTTRAVDPNYKFAFITPLIPMDSPMGGNIEDWKVTSPFGSRNAIVNSVQTNSIAMHNGVDFGVASGTPLHAAAPGRVSGAVFGSTSGYGNYITIEHVVAPGTVVSGADGKQYEVVGLFTRYAHMTSLNVKEGDVIQSNCSGYSGSGRCLTTSDVIGYSGNTGNSTGPHLHFEVFITAKDLETGQLLPTDAANTKCDPYYWLTTKWAKGATLLPGGYNNTEIEAIIAKAKSQDPTLSDTREKLMRNALSLVGKVGYFWGGGHEGAAYIGVNPDWGKSRLVTVGGHRTSGTYVPYGLDCSGFTRWALVNTINNDPFNLGNTVTGQWNSTSESQNAGKGGAINVSPKPGDFAVTSTKGHVGIYLYTNEQGQKVYVHCSNGVEVGTYSKFVSFFTPPGLN